MRRFLPAALVLISAPLLAAQPPEPPPTLRQPPPAPGTGIVYPPGKMPHYLTRQHKELIPGLIDALKDTDAEVRQHAALALAAIGHEAIGPLTKALEDPVKDKRTAAAYALGQMGLNGQEAIPALLKTLKDEEPAVRRAGAQALSRVVSGDAFAGGRMMPGMPAFGRGAPLGAGSPPPLPEVRPRPLTPEPARRPEPEAPKSPDK